LKSIIFYYFWITGYPR